VDEELDGNAELAGAFERGSGSLRVPQDIVVPDESRVVATFVKKKLV
jgi:hypothetical protein